MTKELNQSHSKDRMTDGRRLMYFAAAISIALMVWSLITWFDAKGIKGKKTNDEQLTLLGNYGSYLQGTVGSILTAATFFVVMAAFLAQREEIIQNEKEMEEERKSRQLQTFENTFFKLLNLQMEIVSQMRVSNAHNDVEIRRMVLNNERHYTGRECFSFLYDRLITSVAERKGINYLLETMNISTPFPSPAEVLNSLQEKDLIRAQYKTFSEQYQSIVGHYFRHLYHILKYVNESQITEKARYVNWVIAELSVYELALLFYNSFAPIPPESENKFKTLIEELGVFKNLDCNVLIDSEHKSFYAETAFAAN